MGGGRHAHSTRDMGDMGSDEMIIMRNVVMLASRHSNANAAVFQ
ncbi:hypothetical protein AvCA_03270 [Azotobacter vinelandii CA]|uniref:Uncharacterized protein n=2 Tax=Azotobacter vinelandii TaxID=354 RepID=C1DI90_AZOVD|nr:hypothetical protein Avin_03270 [Azotobacter vinelandii DJ]AGK17351.1 hypothetical protein AvCA_03270 [Azotobacter vinelandii CA]AGK19218.1 hypothetical protein AvCA6_03270 [Azotobacter vinelandii CA6]